MGETLDKTWVWAVRTGYLYAGSLNAEGEFRGGEADLLSKLDSWLLFLAGLISGTLFPGSSGPIYWFKTLCRLSFAFYFRLLPLNPFSLMGEF